MVDHAYSGLKSRACESVKLRANEEGVSSVKEFNTTDAFLRSTTQRCVTYYS